MDNNFAVEIRNRIARAWGAFSVHRELLLHKQGSLKKRLMLLDMTVKQAIMWGAGTWNLTTKQEQSISGIQRKMIRTMLRIRMYRVETMEDYMRRCENLINDVMFKFEVESWVDSWRRIQFNWGGKVVQQGLLNRDRLTNNVLEHYDIQSIKDFAKTHKGWQGHARRFHPWRWETEISNYFWHQGVLWRTIAEQPAMYKEHLEKYIAWRKHCALARGSSYFR